jgi:hypothetical protein
MVGEHDHGAVHAVRTPDASAWPRLSALHGRRKARKGSIGPEWGRRSGGTMHARQVCIVPVSYMPSKWFAAARSSGAAELAVEPAARAGFAGHVARIVARPCAHTLPTSAWNGSRSSHTYHTRTARAQGSAPASGRALTMALWGRLTGSGAEGWLRDGIAMLGTQRGEPVSVHRAAAPVSGGHGGGEGGAAMYGRGRLGCEQLPVLCVPSMLLRAARATAPPHVPPAVTARVDEAQLLARHRIDARIHRHTAVASRHADANWPYACAACLSQADLRTDHRPPLPGNFN